MPDKVADASVVAAMVFEEPRADEAEALIDGDDLFGPTLLAHELTNIACRKVSIGGPAFLIVSQLRTAMAMEVQTVDVDEIAVFRLALDTGLTAYDASYLYVAQRIAAPLVTFDTKLQAAYTSLGP